ncbi:MAG: prolipoprotein diacylglyceryl transferase [Syntrophales bacterium]
MGSFLCFWQHIPEHISPVLVQIGAFQIRYYSLMYIVAFILTYILVSYRIKTEHHPYTKETVQNFLFWAIIGLIIGARLGYVFFYNLSYYIRHPLEIISPFDYTNGFRFVGISGMSYHGGAIGVLAASIFYCRNHNINFWYFADLVCPVIPLGYTFGRIGNFMNGELYGRATTVPWGMYFPLDPTHALRHPSQLYEAFFEGIVLFVLLWLLRKRKIFEGAFLGLYIIGYGLVRFFIEFVREPDTQLGFVLGFLSMGQVLCLAMILCGIILLVYRKHKLSSGPFTGPARKTAQKNAKRA